jgi:hypothetical protein
MRKEDLDRRSAELKERLLAQRNGDAQENPSVVTKGRSSRKARQQEDGLTVESSGGANVSALKKRIAHLEKENESLRQRLALMSTSPVGPARASDDSVREQRHNFFKYSNARRY